jgi:hydrogenase maturation factor
VENATIEEFIANALTNDNVPTIYLNGFSLTITPSEMLLVGKRGEHAKVALYLPHSVAKSLVDVVGRALAEYQTKAGVQILSLDQIKANLALDDDEN